MREEAWSRAEQGSATLEQYLYKLVKLLGTSGQSYHDGDVGRQERWIGSGVEWD